MNTNSNSSLPISTKKNIRKASEPFILPWEDGEAFKLTPNYFKKQFTNYKLTIKEDSIWANVKSLVGDILELEIRGAQRGISLTIKLHEEFLYLQCSCNKSIQTVCNHAYLAIIEKAERHTRYFERFYFPEIIKLNEKHRSFFNIDMRYYYDYYYRTPDFKPHEKYGRVFNFSKVNESYDDKLVLTSPQVVLAESKQKLVFGIPLHDYHYSIPVLLPYLTKTGTKASLKNPYSAFENSYLFDQNRTLLSLTIEEEQIQAVCKKMLAILDMPEEQLLTMTNAQVNEEDYAQTVIKVKKDLIVKIWKALIPKLDKHEVFMFRANQSGKIYVKPTASTNFKPKILLKKVKISFQLIEDHDYFQLKLFLFIDGVQIAEPSIIASQSSFFLNTGEDELVFVDNTDDEEVLQQFRECNFCLTILPQDLEEFKIKILKPILEHYEITYHTDLQSTHFIEKEPMQVLQKRVSFVIKDDFLIIKPTTIYPKSILLNPLQKGNSILLSVDGKEEIHFRAGEAEKQFRTLLQSMHPEFLKQSATGQFQLPLSQVNQGAWLAQTTHLLQENEIKILGLEDLQGLPINPHPLKLDMAIKGDKDWFTIGLDLACGKQKLTLEQLQKVLKKGKEIIELPDGSVGSIPMPLQEQMKSLLRIGEINKKELRVSSRHFNSMQSFANKIVDPALLERIKLQRKKLQSLDSIQTLEKPGCVNAILRPYQLAGFSWLGFLREFGWGGILADDMGLGKTLQVLTILEHHYQLEPKAATSLIVLPNSLLFNWQQEILKFTPHREVIVHHGTNRPTTLEIGKAKILLTTYGTLMSDNDLFTKKNFSYLVLDESQSIKNPKSKRYSAVQNISSSFRLALTGTPIENGISDLFAQLDFVNPGFLGSYGNFKRNFSGISAGTASQETIEELQRIIDPFLLRRTKSQVAKDLPEKTEMVIYCEMLPEQRLIYEHYRQGFREKLEDKVDERIEKAKFFVLEGLMKLRQICNSPAMIKNEKHPNHSIKLKEVQEHILEKTQGHKILIFSSFTSMLGLLRNQLETSNITYAYLDGKTPQELRQSQVNRFQEDESCRVFLISLKAGGTGLNLTAADYVYILDPWWNPASEAQAIDRCYRIGQEKHVMAYRMICKDSIEEKILDLQKGKRELADMLIQTDQSVLKSLNKDDLLSLFD